jgi:hypothetical protein
VIAEKRDYGRDTMIGVICGIRGIRSTRPSNYIGVYPSEIAELVLLGQFGVDDPIIRDPAVYIVVMEYGLIRPELICIFNVSGEEEIRGHQTH